MSIESAISEINDAGFELNNLFQIDRDFWRCNLRSSTEKTFFDFGQGKTPEEALRNALGKVHDEKSDDVAEDDFSDFLE